MNEESLLAAAREEGFDQFAAGAYVCNAHREVLLLRRARGEYLGGLYELPSGRMEPGEALRAALARELREETGLELQEVHGYVGHLDYGEGGHQVRQLNFHVSVEPASEVILSAEHDAFLWLGEASPRLGALDPVSRRLLEAFYRQQARSAAALIAFEGLDGVGKTAYARETARWFGEAERGATWVEEFPASFLNGYLDRLRTVDPYLALSAELPTPLSGTLLIAASHAYKYETAIRPALDQGRLVLVDRFIDSVYAYQVPILRRFGLTELEAERFLAGLFPYVPLPDLVVYLTRDRAEARQSRGLRGDDLARESEAFLDEVARSYDRRLSGSRWVVHVHVEGSQEQVRTQIVARVEAWLAARGSSPGAAAERR